VKIQSRVARSNTFELPLFTWADQETQNQPNLATVVLARRFGLKRDRAALMAELAGLGGSQ
jgi:hypothetical protein